MIKELKSSNKKIIYIVGSGHSGSTLLELLLGEFPNTCSLGEFHAISDWIKNDKVCGCGSAISVCDFWADIIERQKNLSTTCDPSLKTANLTFFEKIRSSCAPFFCPSSRSSFLPEGHREAMIATQAWFDAVFFEYPMCQAVIDTSKDVRRMAFLSKWLPQVRVVWLIRDPRAVVSSGKKRKLGCYSELLKYIKKNLYILISLFLLRKSFLVVSYSQLCNDGKRTCSALLGECADGNFRFRKGNTHGIKGNPMRFRRSERKITEDLSWKENLRTSEKFMASILGLPLYLIITSSTFRSLTKPKWLTQ